MTRPPPPRPSPLPRNTLHNDKGNTISLIETSATLFALLGDRDLSSIAVQEAIADLKRTKFFTKITEDVWP